MYGVNAVEDGNAGGLLVHGNILYAADNLSPALNRIGVSPDVEDGTDPVVQKHFFELLLAEPVGLVEVIWLAF